MNLSKRLDMLEQAQEAKNKTGPAILIPDLYYEGAEAAIERWQAENKPVPANTFFIILVDLK